VNRGSCPLARPPVVSDHALGLHHHGHSCGVCWALVLWPRALGLKSVRRSHHHQQHCRHPRHHQQQTYCTSESVMSDQPFRAPALRSGRPTPKARSAASRQPSSPPKGACKHADTRVPHSNDSYLNRVVAELCDGIRQPAEVGSPCLGQGVVVRHVGDLELHLPFDS